MTRALYWSVYCRLHVNASLRRCVVYGPSEKAVPAGRGQQLRTLDVLKAEPFQELTRCDGTIYSELESSGETRRFFSFAEGSNFQNRWNPAAESSSECRSYQEMQVCPCWGTSLWSFTGTRSPSAGRGSRNTGAGCSSAGCWTDRRSSSAPCGGWESCSLVSSACNWVNFCACFRWECKNKARTCCCKEYCCLFITILKNLVKCIFTCFNFFE